MICTDTWMAIVHWWLELSSDLMSAENTNFIRCGALSSGIYHPLKADPSHAELRAEMDSGSTQAEHKSKEVLRYVPEL